MNAAFLIRRCIASLEKLSKEAQVEGYIVLSQKLEEIISDMNSTAEGLDMEETR